MEKTYGNICVQHFSVKWKIPDVFFVVPSSEEFESPEFEFCGANWSIVISQSPLFPECIDFALVKRNFSHMMHPVSYKISLLKDFRKRYRPERVKHNFFSLDCRSAIYCDIYSELQKIIHIIAPERNVTICCTMECDILLKNSASTTLETGSEKLIRDMETLFSNGQGSDVTLVVGACKFPVHSAILGIRSSVFAAMFSHDMKEKSSGLVNITDFDPDIFRDFLLYLYTAKVEKLSSKTAVGLYSAADKYDTQELKTKCVEFMRDNLSLDMFCSVVSLALQHEESSLLEAAMKFFVKNLKQIIVTIEWQTFMKKNPAAANELHIKASDFYTPPEEKL